MTNAPRLDAEKIAHEMERRGLAWADANAAAEALEETAKSVLAEVALSYKPDAKSMTEAETMARADQKYIAHIKAAVSARKTSNRARVAYDTYKVYAEMLRSNASTDRALATMR